MQKKEYPSFDDFWSKLQGIIVESSESKWWHLVSRTFDYSFQRGNSLKSKEPFHFFGCQYQLYPLSVLTLSVDEPRDCSKLYSEQTRLPKWLEIDLQASVNSKSVGILSMNINDFTASDASPRGEFSRLMNFSKFRTVWPDQ